MSTEPSHFFRFYSRFGRVLTVVVVAASVLVLVVATVNGRANDAALLLPALALLSFLAWAGFWRPAIDVGAGGITVRNVWHTTQVAWPEVQRIDTRFALTLYTVHGRVTAWAAPAPDRHAVFRAVKSEGGHLPESTYLDGTVRPGDLITTDSGQVAYVIRTHWERLRDEGRLDGARSEFPVLRRRWHWLSLTIAATLAVATLVSAMV